MAIPSIFKFWQNGRHSKILLAKRLLLKQIWRCILVIVFVNIMIFTKNVTNMSQGPPNPEFRSVKVQTETFLKKDSRDLKNSFYLGFLWIPSKPEKQNWKVPFFWVFIIVKKQCVFSFRTRLLLNLVFFKSILS